MNWTGVVLVVQLFFGVVIGLYFLTLLRNQRTQKVSIDKESKKEMEQLQKLRAVSLTKPLAEKVRPSSFKEVIGQEDGIRALRAAICGPNPQHVIVYGPPGVGKTAAARLVLEEAKRNKNTPFRPTAVFVELDATTARFDERGIADPLIGSVHDPLYQGAGAMGQAGIPQPKQGAVTKAHGGVLFIDEIGELHPIQMNKLLKVLEDRKVFLESAYYNEENQTIPTHIHDIFQKGLPADFRLIGATTRGAHEIPPAIRSRCVEIYFRELTQTEIKTIAMRAAQKVNCHIDPKAVSLTSMYAKNGREAVNMIQIAAGLATAENREKIMLGDIEWVVHSSQMSPRPERQIPQEATVGLVNGLAVYGANTGALLEIEATVKTAEEKIGKVTITGIIEEESMGNQGKSVRRKSLAKGSVENVLTVLKNMGIRASDYDIHINFPGGVPVDGPSAGVAVATAIVSAIQNVKVNEKVAMTGEISIRGKVKPVGGIVAKVAAAKEAGAEKVIIPKENDSEMLREMEGITVIAVSEFQEVLNAALLPETDQEEVIPASIQTNESPTTKI